MYTLYRLVRSNTTAHGTGALHCITLGIALVIALNIAMSTVLLLRAFNRTDLKSFAGHPYPCWVDFKSIISREKQSDT